MAATLGMSRCTAQIIARNAGYQPRPLKLKDKKPKLVYDITPERLLEISKNRNPEVAIIKQKSALSALELAFGKIRS